MKLKRQAYHLKELFLYTLPRDKTEKALFFGFEALFLALGFFLATTSSVIDNQAIKFDIYFHFDNPRYLRDVKFGKASPATAPHLFCIWEDENMLTIARGFTRELIKIFHANRVSFEIVNASEEIPETSFNFEGVLQEYQMQEVDPVLVLFPVLLRSLSMKSRWRNLMQNPWRAVLLWM